MSLIYAETSYGEFSPEPSDESEEESDLSDVEEDANTSELIRRAKEAGNIRDNPRTSAGRGTPDPSKKAGPQKKRKGAETVVDSVKSPEGLKKKRSKNAEIFPPEIRPDWLKDYSAINSLNALTVAGIIVQNKMTEALNKQNTLKEEKANKSKGGLRVDMDIKMITVTPGEGNATNVLHP